ncbi:hypothetical protein [Desulfovibrio sp. ZJ369]|uniref:hypothetical protein n=1 Tax=Desulfovibrio sp. ZJ369 TaxID=2709793 RepID=UPI00197D6184|nr:hypothetical protein [Desulfovibrio sp. ZJ369]
MSMRPFDMPNPLCRHAGPCRIPQRGSASLVLFDRLTVDESLKNNTLKRVHWQYQLLEKNFPYLFCLKNHQ